MAMTSVCVRDPASAALTVSARSDGRHPPVCSPASRDVHPVRALTAWLQPVFTSRSAGTVQGVGYRPWVYQLARALGIGGRVWNHSRGVSIEAHVNEDVLQHFTAASRSEGAAGGIGTARRSPRRLRRASRFHPRRPGHLRRLPRCAIAAGASTSRPPTAASTRSRMPVPCAVRALPWRRRMAKTSQFPIRSASSHAHCAPA